MKIKVFLVIFSAVFGFTSCKTDRNVDFKKYDILLKPSEISTFYNIKTDTSGKSESGFIRKWNDGHYEMHYTYDLSDSDVYHPLYYTIEIKRSNTEEEAIHTFELIKKVILRKRNSKSKESVTEIDSIVNSGDQNFYAIANWEDKPNGILFLYRKKNMVYGLRFYHLVTTDHSVVKYLIEPKLKNLENFKL